MEDYSNVDEIFAEYFYLLDTQRQNEIEDDFQAQDDYGLLTEYYVVTYHRDKLIDNE